MTIVYILLAFGVCLLALGTNLHQRNRYNKKFYDREWGGYTYSYNVGKRKEAYDVQYAGFLFIVLGVLAYLI